MLLLIGSIGSSLRATELVQVELRIVEIKGHTEEACKTFVQTCQANKKDGMDDLLRIASTTRGLTEARTVFGVLLTTAPDTFATITALEKDVTRVFHLKPGLRPLKERKQESDAELQLAYEEFGGANGGLKEIVSYQKVHTGPVPRCLFTSDPHTGGTSNIRHEGDAYSLQVIFVQAAAVDDGRVTSRPLPGDGLTQIGLRMMDMEGENLQACENFYRKCEKPEPGNIDAVVRQASRVGGVKTIRASFNLDVAARLSTPVRIITSRGDKTVDIDMRVDNRDPITLALGIRELFEVFDAKIPVENYLRTTLGLGGVPKLLRGGISNLKETLPDGTVRPKFEVTDILMMDGTVYP